MVRSSAIDDLPRVLALLEQAGLPTDGVSDHFENSYAVAEVDGELVGAAGLEIYDVDGLLRSVVVHPERRGSGLGVELVRDRLQWARDRNLRDLYLLTETAHDFFGRMGFVDVERGSAPAAMQKAPEFSHLCPSSSATMRLHLD